MLAGGNIIGTTWLNTTNSTPFEDILAIDSAFWQLHGYPLRHVWLNSKVWGYVTNNAGIKARAGSANQVFIRFNNLGRVDNTDVSNDQPFIGELRCLPGIQFHVYNGGINMNGTFTKFFGDTQAVFHPEPSPDWCTMIQGSEFVQQNEFQPARQEEVPFFYPQYVREPARIEEVGIDLAQPVLRVPKAVAIGTVVF